MIKFLFFAGMVMAFPVQAKPRARDLGIPFQGIPGPLNALTDVLGVEVGFTTLIKGQGKLRLGKGPVRTGVTAILPLGKSSSDQVFAGWYSLNGNGEMTGTTWLEESGILEGPIMLTNTHSVGVVRDAVVEWRVNQKRADEAISLPVVAETWDGYLNDINGFHVKKGDAIHALDTAETGMLREGAVGSGTGMVCFEFKCGIGTSSRIVKTPLGEFTVGVLVQSNFGLRKHLVIAGIPVGIHFPSDLVWSKEVGSIIAVVATDAPLLPHQLKRMAKRASLGLARLGGISGDGSGDIFVAFSTHSKIPKSSKGGLSVSLFPNGELDPLFGATVEAVEESIVNALIAGETMVGVDNHRVVALPQKKVVELLKTSGRLSPLKQVN